MAEPIDRLLQSIRQGQACSCFLLCGDETFLLEEASGRIMNALFPDGSDELTCFKLDGERVAPDEIIETILTPSLIPGRKAVVVKNTNILASGSTRSSLPENYSHVLMDDPEEAARSFLGLLGAKGWSLRDLAQGGWRQIADDEWRRFFSGTDVSDFSRVVPELVGYCLERGMEERSSRGDTERLEAVIADGLPPDQVLILTARTVDRRKKLFKTIDEKGAVLQFAREKSDARQKSALGARTREFLAAQGVAIAPDALDLLLDRAGLDFVDIAAEANKLVTWLGDTRSRISREDVEAVTGHTREEPVYELTNAVADKDPERGLMVLKRLMDQGVHPLALLALIAREVRLLMQAKLLVRSGRVPSSLRSLSYRQFQERLYPSLADKAAKGKGGKGTKKGKAGLVSLHPYVVYNTLGRSERFTWDELVGLTGALAETDVALKSSGGDPTLLMKRLIFQMVRPGPS